MRPSWLGWYCALVWCATEADVIYFPEDRPFGSSFGSKGPLQIGSGYDSYVDDVIAQGVTNLCLSLDRAVIDRNRQEDSHVYSPLSVATALALVLLGSNGRTFEEIATLLGLAHGVNIHSNSGAVHEHFGNLVTRLESTSVVKAASAIFVQSDFPIREQYKRTASNVYSSEVMNLDFKTAASRAQNIINSWVSGKTNGRIQSVLAQEPPPDTKLVIVSTLYLKAEWEKPFTAEITSRRPFYGEGKEQPSTGDAWFMANGGFFPYYNDVALDCQVLGLPYKGGALTFYAVVPNRSDRRRLRDLQNRLNSNELQRLASSTDQAPLIILFPKMKLETTLELNDELKYLGLTTLFSPTEANLALLSPGKGGTQTSSNSRRRRREQQFRLEDSLDYIRTSLNRAVDPENPGLYADQVIHKVWLEITEAGTEAAAATSVSLTRDGTRKNFVVDTPFFFFIRHEPTKMLLFWGSVNRPPSI